MSLLYSVKISKSPEGQPSFASCSLPAPLPCLALLPQRHSTLAAISANVAPPPPGPRQGRPPLATDLQPNQTSKPPTGHRIPTTTTTKNNEEGAKKMPLSSPVPHHLVRQLGCNPAGSSDYRRSGVAPCRPTRVCRRVSRSAGQAGHKKNEKFKKGVFFLRRVGDTHDSFTEVKTKKNKKIRGPLFSLTREQKPNC